ncbi:FAD-dependent monooxygenase [Amycolatopsis anabasis]|uniref:FAD-dependent monooxygenase n=1 Tax=Amycolatopsis anabasis TaxID=1840409 RepID=UPI00131C4799|nr:FAD-dependent monooxygenase [Amycolatopsis anabasis]
MTVVVAGAGPAGLMLSAELALAGVEVLVVDQLPRRSPICRGFTLNARSLELLDRRGIADRFLEAGPTVPYSMFADPARPLDLTAMDTDHPYVLGIAQTLVEELLEQWLAELGVPVRWGHEVVGCDQDDTGVGVTLRVDGAHRRIRADYLVGCDGSRSIVRKLAGIGFPGTDATTFSLLADVELADPADLPFGVTEGEHGTVFVIPRPGYVRIVLDEPEPPGDRDQPVQLAHFQNVLDQALGRRVALREPRWLTRFSDAARQADRYVAGRIMLTGDAAHIHPPAGAVGVNVALADAVNLGWKLAATTLGHAPDGLLDSYHEERHPAGARVLRTTRVQTVLGRRETALDPVRDLFSELTALAPVGKYLAELITGVSTRYDPKIPGEHPWLGRLAPNLKLITDGEHTSIAKLLRTARPVLLELGDRTLPTGPESRVTAHRARCPEHPDLEGLLIRPDGHTAWISTQTDPQPTDTLTTALTTWFGDGTHG